MNKFIKYYKDLMNKYILVKVGTILLIVMLLSQIATVINKSINKKNTNENPVSKYNTYSSETLTIKDVSERYFNEYISLLKYDIELAYELLEENCKSKYKDINDFKNYIQKIDLANIKMSNYSITENEEYKKYVVDDNINNVYSFIVENANEYNVILESK